MDYFEYDAWDGHDPETAWEAAVDQFLERSQRRQKDRLAAELDRVDDQLDRRDAIHDEIVDELEWKIERYTDQLERLHGTARGKQDGTCDRLRDRLATFEQQLREEHREHWQDRQALERERRALHDELAELDDTDLSELL